jgi:hypothetical protein
MLGFDVWAEPRPAGRSNPGLSSLLKPRASSFDVDRSLSIDPSTISKSGLQTWHITAKLSLMMDSWLMIWQSTDSSGTFDTKLICERV